MGTARAVPFEARVMILQYIIYIYIYPISLAQLIVAVVCVGTRVGGFNTDSGPHGAARCNLCGDSTHTAAPETRGSHHVHQSRRRTRRLGTTEALNTASKCCCLFSVRKVELPILPCSACIYPSQPSSRPEGLSHHDIHCEGLTCYACMTTPSSRGRHEPP